MTEARVHSRRAVVLRRSASMVLSSLGITVALGAVGAFAFFIFQDASNFFGAQAQASSLSAPTSPVVTVNGSQKLTVSWTLPVSQLTGAQYQVVQTAPGAPSTICTVSSATTSCPDTGLTPATSYSFSVKAVLSSWQSSTITSSATTSTPVLTVSIGAGPYTAGSSVAVSQITAKVAGVTDTTYAGTKTMTWSGLANSPSGTAPLYPSSSVTFTNGVASPGTTFTAYKAAASTLSVADAAAPVVSGSTSFTVGFASAAKLSFTTSPSLASTGTAFIGQPVVAVQDLYGNVVTSDSSSVTLAITAGTPSLGGPGTLGSCSQSESSGIVTFSSCKITTTGRNYSLTATDGVLTSGVSSTFDVSGAADHLVIATQPSSSTSAVVLPTQVVVNVVDSLGSIVPGDSSTGVLAITGGTPSAGGPGTLAGCSQSETFGVATFSGCKITGAGRNYSLTASDGVLTSATTSTFNIAGVATKVVVTSSPSSSSGGTIFATQPVVTVQDALGSTVTTDSSTVTLAITAGTPSSGGPGTLSGCSASESLGVVTFTGCKINTAGTAYSLTASDAALTNGVSGTFNVTVGSPTQIVVTANPSASTGGIAFVTQVKLSVQDAGGNVVTTDSSTATLVIATGTPTSGGPGTLSGCAQSETAGVISFSGCKIDTAGSNYALTATDGALPSATTTAFNVTVGPAAKLNFTTSPSNSSGGISFATQPVVTVLDAGNNVVTSDSSTVSLAITSGTPASGGPGTLSGCSASETLGVVTFTGCKINTSGAGYSLRATDGVLTLATSSTFNVTVGTATQIKVTTQPAGATGGTAFTTQPKVSVQDAGGNVVTTDVSTVAISITGGTPASGGPGVLSTCTTSETLGVVTFSGCKINTAGTGYSLTVSDGALTGDVTSTFNVTVGPAKLLTFTATPSASTGAVVFGTQPIVAVQDAGGNLVTTANNSTTLAISSGTGTLLCTTNPLAASSGIVSFAGCKITLGTDGNFALKASATGLTSATSTTFTVYGVATKLIFTTQPTASTSGSNITVQPVVSIEDAASKVVPLGTQSVTLGIATGTGTLSCTANPVSGVLGVVSFTGCKITLGTQGSFTLSATATGLTSTNSSAFTVAGPATKIIVGTQPGAGASGSALIVQPSFKIEDSSGSVVTTSTAPVSLALASGVGSLACTTNPVNAVAGVATFAGCAVTLGTQGNFTVTASSSGLTPITSSNFTVAGTATKVVFTSTPSSSTGGSNFAIQPVAKIQDSSGDVVTNSSASVTLSIASGTGTLTCTTNPVTAVAGTATFAGCKITLGTQGNFTLSAVSSGLTSATTVGFSVAGTATQVVFTTQPTNSTGGSNITVQPIAKIEDSSGDVVTTSVAPVTLAIASGTGTLTCTTNPLTAVAGVATFVACKVTLGTQGAFTLSAAASGLSTATSNSFAVAGAATQVVFTTQPGSSTGGTNFTVQPVAKIEDSSGNVVTASATPITLAIGTGTGTLTCTTNPVTAVGGVATFAGCKVTLGTQGAFTLSASASGLSSATTSSFTVAGAASKLVFITQPASSSTATVFGVQPQLFVEDSSGDLVTTSVTSTTLAINSGTGTLTCTTNPVAAVAGIVNFAGCKIALGTQGTFTLKATGSLVTQATGNSFTVAGVATQLVFSTQPIGAAAGSNFATQPVLLVEDSSGDVVTSSSASVTLTITGGTGSAGAVLTCTTNPLTASSGVITFAGCRIDRSGSNFTLTATSAGLSTAVSSTFTIT
jgi:hypothetical protein